MPRKRLSPRPGVLRTLIVGSLAIVPGIAGAQQSLTRAGGEIAVNTFTTSNQNNPSVAVDAAGNALVVWTSNDQDGSNPGIYARRFAKGVPAGIEFRVNTTTTKSQTGSAVAAMGSGSFVVVWTSQDQDSINSQGVFGQRFSGSGPLGGEFRVNTVTASDQADESVGSDGAGNFVVVWSEIGSDGSNFGIVGQRFASSGGPVGAAFRVNTYTTLNQEAPAVARDAAGNFVVTWQNVDAGYDIFGQRFASTGEKLGSEFQVNVATGVQVGRAGLAFGGSGFVVTWATRVGPSATEIRVRRFNSAGAPLGGELTANSIAGQASDPGAVLDAGGDFEVAWNALDDHYGGIYARRFTSAGVPFGEELLVNTYTTSSQTRPTIAGASTGRFIVAWESSGQDGHLGGIYAQRLCKSAAGDANGDGLINVSDVLYLINNLFAGGADPVRPSDVNGDGSVNVTDVLYLINFLFAGGPPPECA